MELVMDRVTGDETPIAVSDPQAPTRSLLPFPSLVPAPCSPLFVVLFLLSTRVALQVVFQLVGFAGMETFSGGTGKGHSGIVIKVIASDRNRPKAKHPVLVLGLPSQRAKMDNATTSRWARRVQL